MIADELFKHCDRINFTHHWEPRSVTIEARDKYERADDWRTAVGDTLTLTVPGIGIPDITLRFMVLHVAFGGYNGHVQIELQSIGAPLEPKEANP